MKSSKSRSLLLAVACALGSLAEADPCSTNCNAAVPASAADPRIAPAANDGGVGSADHGCGAMVPDAMAGAVSGAASESWAVHGQATGVTQFHPRYTSPYEGPNSLNPGNNGRETLDLTLFVGASPWPGAQAWLNPELDQGYGLDDTLGVAGFTSAEAYKVGATNPYFRVPRAFIRQVIELGGQPQAVAPAANQLGGTQTTDGVTLTLGKFSVIDVFDTNRYAHDPRGDFLNWAVVDAGAFDYAADAWGYTFGSAIEWTRSWWTLRGGVFDLSRTPNSKELERSFGQFALIGELEERHEVAGHAGDLKVLGFVNRGRMARYDDAVSAAPRPGTPPDPAAVRRYASRPGVALNLEQELRVDLGIFGRASINDGSKEAFDFTDINRSMVAGGALHGDRWNRNSDTLGFAAVLDNLSAAARRFFAAGGLGILVGDGQLPHYGAEKIAETYYSAQVGPRIVVTADFQYVVNPAYNRDRGPVCVFALRLHGDI